MKKIKLPPHLSSLLPLIFILLAAYLLHRQLQAINFLQFREEIKLWEVRDVVLAFGLTSLNFLVLSFYDVVALRSMGLRLPFRQVIPTALAAFSISNIVGHAYFSGTSVRLKTYARAGLTMSHIAQLALLNSLTFWLGFCGLLGTILLSVKLPEGLPLFLAQVAPLLGSVLTLLCCLYLGMCWKWSGQIVRWRQFQLQVPPAATGFLQLLLGCLDLSLVALILYVLLPNQLILAFMPFFTDYLSAQFLAVISQVPGGLGVLDGTLLHLLVPHADGHQLIVSILLFRFIYYVLPLTLTIGGKLCAVFWRQRQQFSRSARLSQKLIDPFIAQALAGLTAWGGLVLIASGVMPSVDARLRAIDRWLPFPLIEVSHLVASIVGLGLLFLAQKIWRKNFNAFRAILIFLLIGIPASLLKGFDWEEASILLLILLLLMPFRRVFYRRVPLLTTGRPGPYDLLLGSVLIAAVVLGLFVYRDVTYSHELWITFQAGADAARFLRSTAVLVSIFFVFVLWQYLRGGSLAHESLTPETIDRLKEILATVTDTEAQLVLLGDKHVRLSDDGKAFLMFGVYRRSWIVLGDVYGLQTSAQQVLENFLDEADSLDQRPVFYQCNEEFVPRLLEAGLQVVKLGEEAHIELPAFSLEGHARKLLRAAFRRGEREGLSFQILEPDALRTRIEELRAVSEAWLKNKHLAEKGFSLGFFKDDYLLHFACAVVVIDQKIVGFANILKGAGLELSVDLMRYNPEIESKVIMDFLFVSILQWGRDQGFRTFNLGMAPLSGLKAQPWGPLWYKFAQEAFNHGEVFYNFRGLRSYKEKYQPIWKSRYLASDGGLSFAQALADIALLVGGGLKGVLGRSSRP